ncbi:hypothetical protein L6164_011260 [Bauhinia variegata]|uniref:Uncharacterized protein n=1 Tax=Bauhinia variegata TaxID=167791 RepID=A0ACB9P5A7_BAUVA|nr:hypothetical protein L6164_011260 [Bauhinia variegata]
MTGTTKDSALMSSLVACDDVSGVGLKESKAVKHSFIELPMINGSEGSLKNAETVNSSKKSKSRNKRKRADKEAKDEGANYSLDNSSMKTRASVKDLCNESSAVHNLVSSQISAEVSSTSKRKNKKKKKTIHGSIDSNVNDSCVSEDNFSIETSTPALNIPRQVQDVSVDPVMGQSCEGRKFDEAEYAGKEPNVLEKAAETSKAEHDLQEVSSKQNSVVAKAENFMKESVLEVVKLNTAQCINYNSSKPGDNDGYIKNASLVKKLDDYSLVHGASQKCQNFKTYTRRKGVKTSFRIDGNHPGPVHYNEEQIIEDHNKDDSQKNLDEPLAAESMYKLETKLSRDKVTANGEASSDELKPMRGNMCDQGFMTDVSVVDIPEVQLAEKIVGKLDGIEVTGHDMSSAGSIADLSLISKEDDPSRISHFSLDRTLTSLSKKKLLVLDLNGLLADFVEWPARGYKADMRLSKKSVFKRPFCDDFLQFCFDKFHVGVWSSRHRVNVYRAVKFLMGKLESKLLFCWHQYHCTTTKFSTVEDKKKPLVLKELRKLWVKLEPGLPWEKGDFNESNTLLLDDSPYKALRNPANTAIFPYSYQYTDTNDASLGPGGDLRVYLEGLALAENVQEYVASNPFGQRAIRESNPSWRYYLKVIEGINTANEARTSPPCSECCTTENIG